MKNIRWTLLALLLAAAPQVARAQAPIDPAASGTTTTTTVTQGAPDSGDISTSSTSTTTTTTSTEGINPDVTAEVTPMDSTDTLPNTGGEPLIMSVAGLAIAAAAFGIRRKVTA